MLTAVNYLFAFLVADPDPDVRGEPVGVRVMLGGLVPVRVSLPESVPVRVPLPLRVPVRVPVPPGE